MKKKLLILLSLMFFAPFIVNAYEVKMDWQKSFGSSVDDYFYNAFETEDGGFITVVNSYSSHIENFVTTESYDVIMVKYDKDGNIVWQKSWGGSSADNSEQILSTKDGGFVMVGNSFSTDIEGLANKGGEDAIIVKFDKDFNLLWQRSFGGNLEDGFKKVLETDIGEFIAFGYSSSTDSDFFENKGNRDVVIAKYDSNGNLLWHKNWGGNKVDEIYDVALIGNGEFVFSGSSTSTDLEDLPNKGVEDAIIVKCDSFGNVIWQKSWGGSSYDKLYKILMSEDGGAVFVGYSFSTDIAGFLNKGSLDFIFVKYNKDGNIVWQKSWGGNNDEEIYDVLEIDDGGYVITGYSCSTNLTDLLNNDGCLSIILRYDKDWNIVWQKLWGDNYGNGFNTALQTEDGGFIAFGTSDSTNIEEIILKGELDAIVVKYDKEGNLLLQKNWGGNNTDEFNDVILTKDGGFIAFGTSNSTDIDGVENIDLYDVIMVKYSIIYDLGNTTTSNGTSTVKQQGKYGIITPSPNEGYEVDKIIVKDNDGNVLDVELTKQEDGTYSFELYTDVSVEVLFKEKIENPKTGILDVITILFVGLFISFSGFFIVKRYNERLEF